jgi:hypothetical protein
MEPPDVEPEALEARVRALLADNPKRLSIVVGALLPGLPVHERFKAVGRIAALVAQDAHVLREIERPWVSVPTGLVLEDWPIEPKELT